MSLFTVTLYNNKAVLSQVVEETDMWRQREKEIKRHDSQGSNYSFLKDRGVDMRYEFPVSRERRAHMDEEPRSTYWMKELYKAEEADNNRCLKMFHVYFNYRHY